MGKLLTMKEAADRLRRSEKALAYQVHVKKGPPSALIAGRRMFDEDLLEAWIAEQFEKASA
ncbi:helix-turn-helix domain-containing protein [Agromyces badenianii]|uniref:helix-turn-helix domain-containing protein n=1 Tax=Agromyces badenianii TaxID=2080742 RepID=UPI000D59F7A6|nr:helix-turn-helix domain-containing protein [Agromyces badenianii]PWC05436.1 helix-turn-helix domain-containing protein [Agromyces badenianii]